VGGGGGGARGGTMTPSIIGGRKKKKTIPMGGGEGGRKKKQKKKKAVFFCFFVGKQKVRGGKGGARNRLRPYRGLARRKEKEDYFMDFRGDFVGGNHTTLRKVNRHTTKGNHYRNLLGTKKARKKKTKKKKKKKTKKKTKGGP